MIRAQTTSRMPLQRAPEEKLLSVGRLAPADRVVMIMLRGSCFG